MELWVISPFADTIRAEMPFNKKIGIFYWFLNFFRDDLCGLLRTEGRAGHDHLNRQTRESLADK